jgi:hypothetical protein
LPRSRVPARLRLLLISLLVEEESVPGMV